MLYFVFYGILMSLQQFLAWLNMQQPCKFLFTSQSMSIGQADKLCDYISDSVLDACLSQDPKSKVACQCVLKNQILMIFGQITTNADIGIQSIARRALKQIGYDSLEKGIDFHNQVIIVSIDKQSPQISQSLHQQKSQLQIGAGDQGHVIGYATDETQELMPLSHHLCNLIIRKFEQVLLKHQVSSMGPYFKVQVTVEYEKYHNAIKPLRVDNILILCQTNLETSIQTVNDYLKQKIIKQVVPQNWLKQTKIIINPNGNFKLPPSLIGLTGQKIIADTYGGWGGHGGGAFSGKDSTKVDRSAGYAARWIANSLVSSKLCKRAFVQISYCIGFPQPLSIFVDSFQTVTNGYTDEDLTNIVKNNFDLRPGALIRDLKLNRPIFKKTSHGGHFGRKDPDFTWQDPKLLKFSKLEQSNSEF